MYIDSVLNPIVKLLLEDVKRGHINLFTLEKNGNSGYESGTARNPVRL